jgi:tetratricopeptide (TPR) repeat protein
MLHDACDAKSIADTVERICASPGFRRSARLQRFLRFLASAPAAVGCGPKEYEVAREVYDKPVDFNPQTDPIVRVEASRLRLRLAEYYAGPGRDDELVFEVPKGSYSHYLRGRYMWSRRTPEALQQAIVCFRQAIDDDCFNAAAWSGLADSYLVMGSFEYIRPEVALPHAMAAARRALELNPGSAEAHTSLAAASALYNWDAEAAYFGFERAIALDPGYASAWHFYGIVLFGRGLYERSLQALQRAQSLEPLSSMICVQLASLYYLMRDFGSAAKLCDDLTRLDPVFWPARWFGGMALEQNQRIAEANRYLESAVNLSDRCHWPLAALGHLAGSNGEPAVAERIREELENRRRSAHCPAAAIGLVCVGLGQTNAALEWFDLAHRERSPFIPMFLIGDPRLDRLRTEPDFRKIADALSTHVPSRDG